jgi:tRNA (guanosine-2'-O-)-methyltransferase
MSHRDVDAEREMQRLVASGGTPPVDGDPFDIAGRRLAPGRIVELLQPFMTERRLRRIREVVSRRTRTVVPVIEGLVNTGNVSAVMRSAEALGCQDMHVVRGENERYKHSKRTSQGAQHWLDLWRWDEAEACVDFLHDEGYRVFAMHLSDDAEPIEAVDFTEPTALVFGNEEGGVSDTMRAAADGDRIVPLSGFTESFNVSVAAAIALYHARQDRRRRQGHHADLSDAARRRLEARFCLRSVNNAEAIIARELGEGDDGEAGGGSGNRGAEGRGAEDGKGQR